MITINSLQENRLNDFFEVFKETLASEFPGYNPKLVQYFTDTIYTPYMYAYWLKHKQKEILIAVDSDEIVGYAVIDSPYGGVSLCRWLGIKKEHQRKGIGTQLIDRWIELAIKQGCHKVEVAAQPTAKDFYQKVGLSLEGKRESSYFGISQYIYGKVIGEINIEKMINQ